MKRLMIIAGGEWQIPIIRKAKEMGLFVVNSNPYLDSPGFAFADVGVIANVLDKEKNLEYARKYAIDAVITDQSDIAVTTVAYVADQLRLNGIGLESAARFTNKYLMRNFCSEHGFLVPRYKLCRRFTEAIEFVNSNALPVVVKPPASQSSRGVTKVSSQDALFSAYEDALQHSVDGTVLLEGFIGGVELTVDGIQLNAGGHYCLATSFKTHYSHNEMVAKRLLFSQRHTNIDYEALHQHHNRLMRLMCLPFGLTHAEYKYHKGNFYLIEVAARGGGTRISSDIVAAMSGVDSNELLIRMALGDQINEISPRLPGRFAVLDFFEFSPGKIKEIVGIEQARERCGVIGLGLNVKEGDVIRPAADDRSRHGYILAIAETAEALNALLTKVHQEVQVRYE